MTYPAWPHHPERRTRGHDPRCQCINCQYRRGERVPPRWVWSVKRDADGLPVEIAWVRTVAVERIPTA